MRQLTIFEIPPPFEIVTQKKPSVKVKNKSADNKLKKTHHTHIQYRNTVKNADKHIKELTKYPHEKLEKNLDIIREQMQLAFNKKNYATYELLYEWELQNIIARLTKFIKEEEKEKAKTVAKKNRKIKIVKGNQN